MRALRQCWVVAVILAGMFAGGQSLEAQVRRLFSGGVPGGMYDWVHASNLYQDSARTTLVSAGGDPIGSVTDLSGNDKHASQPTSTSRAVWASGKATLDGVDDGWQTPAIDFSATDKITVVTAIRKASDAATGTVVELGALWTIAGGFGLFGPSSNGSATVAFTSRGNNSNAAANYNNPAVAAPISMVLAGVGRISTDECACFVDGDQVASSGVDQGTGTYRNDVLNIGRRNNTNAPFNGDFGRLFVFGDHLPAGDLAKVYKWAQQAGV